MHRAGLVLYVGHSNHNGAGTALLHLLNIEITAIGEVEFSAHIVFLSALVTSGAGSVCYSQIP